MKKLAGILTISLLVVLFSLLPTKPAAAETVTLYPSADTVVLSTYPGTQYNDYQAMYLFHTPEGERYYSFMQFDLSSVPAGSTINSATLSLYVLDRDAPNYAIPIYRCTELWPTPLIYNNQPSVNLSPVVETTFTAGANSWQTFDLTGLVQGWISGDYPNFGFKIGLPRWIKNAVRFIWTIPSSNYDNSYVRPSLVVDYTIPSASESETGVTSPSTSETLASSTEPKPASSAQAVGSQITKVKAEGIKTSSAYITWTTDVDSNSYVEYGETTKYGKMKAKNDQTTVHSVQLIELKSGKTYHFRVMSTTADGHQVVSKDYTFRTAKVMKPMENETNTWLWIIIGALGLLVLILAGILIFLYIRSRRRPQSGL